MMETETLLKELCYILLQRNEINRRRTRAKDVRGYYNGAANELDKFNAGSTTCKVKPKWIKMGSSCLRAKALQAEQEYVKCKLETHKFTQKHHRKVIKICSELKILLCWNNGYVYGLQGRRNGRYINRERIHELGTKHELDVQMDKMLST